MKPRLVPLMIFLLLMVMAVPLVLRLRMASTPQPVTITKLDLGQDKTIRVTVKPNSQQTLSLHYHVNAPGKPPIENAFFGTLPRTSPPPEFVTYSADHGNLVGLAQASKPNRIIILHDFVTNDSWPHRIVTYKDTDTRRSYPYYEEEPQIMARGEALFSRLTQANPDTPLELLRTMASRPLTVPTAPPQPAQ
jgi:hypothetical protein